MHKVLNVIWILVLLSLLSITFAQEQEAKNESEGNSEVVREGPCDPGEVQVKIINAGTVTCVDNDTAKSWIESDFAVAFDGKSEQRLEQQKPKQQEPEQQEAEQEELEQEIESESNREVSSNIIAENSCDPGQVQVKIIKDDAVRCVEKATADIWIEGNFAVAIDGQSGQEPKQQEAEQKEPEQEPEQQEVEQKELEQETVQESQSEESSETSSEVATEGPCDPGEVQIKLINDGSVRCVDKDTAESWIEGNFAVAFDGQSEQESNQQESNQEEPEQQESEQETPEQEAESESGNEDSSKVTEEVSCDQDEVRVKIVNADSVVCVDEDTANSWIESDFAVKF